jgi:hypothetical protein
MAWLAWYLMEEGAAGARCEMISASLYPALRAAGASNFSVWARWSAISASEYPALRAPSMSKFAIYFF